MKTIYKYPIKIQDFQEVRVLKGGVPIHAGLDPQAQLCVWCEVDASKEATEPLHIFVIGTGHSIPDRARIHLGSFVQGLFVWHIYHP